MKKLTVSQNLHLVSLRALGGVAVSDKWTWRHDNKVHRLNQTTLANLMKLGLVVLTYHQEGATHRGRPCSTAHYSLTPSGAIAAEEAHNAGWRYE